MQFHWHQKTGTHSGEVCNHANIVSLLTIMLLMRISLNFWSFIPCTTEDFILMHCFYSVYSGWKCCLSLMDTTGIQSFLAILKSLPCLLLLAVTLATRCVLAANHASKDVDVFSKQTTLFKKNSVLIHDILIWNYLFLFLGLGLLP